MCCPTHCANVLPYVLQQVMQSMGYQEANAARARAPEAPTSTGKRAQTLSFADEVGDATPNRGEVNPKPET